MGMHPFTNGTSFAAPHITGIVALIRQTMPKASFIQVTEALQTNACSVDWTDDNISEILIEDNNRQQIWEHAHRVHLEQSSETSQAETALIQEVRGIVAHALNLKKGVSRALLEKPLIDPMFDLNAQNCIVILENLQVRFGFSVSDYDLTIEDFYTIKNLALAVNRWCNTMQFNSIVHDC